MNLGHLPFDLQLGTLVQILYKSQQFGDLFEGRKFATDVAGMSRVKTTEQFHKVVVRKLRFFGQIGEMIKTL